MFRTSKILTPITVAAALAGCETVGNTYDNVSALWADPIILPCPEYRILADASRVVQFREGPGRDLVDINIEGRLGDLAMECITNLDKETQSGTMEVAVTVSFGVKRGPANISKKAVVPYFISVADKKRNVLYREEFKVAATFPGNQSAVQFLGETIKLELPLTDKVTSSSYVIYAGLRLNRAQLEYNRRTKNRKRL